MKNDFFTQIPLKQHLTDEWIAPSDEGELSLDMYETSDAMIIKAPIAGVSVNELEIALHQDMLTIRGSREHTDIPHSAKILTNECFWGKFSRSVILPHHSISDKVQAELKNGLLTITLPKAANANTKIPVQEMD